MNVDLAVAFETALEPLGDLFELQATKYMTGLGGYGDHGEDSPLSTSRRNRRPLEELDEMFELQRVGDVVDAAVAFVGRRDSMARRSSDSGALLLARPRDRCRVPAARRASTGSARPYGRRSSTRRCWGREEEQALRTRQIPANRRSARSGACSKSRPSCRRSNVRRAAIPRGRRERTDKLRSAGADATAVAVRRCSRQHSEASVALARASTPRVCCSV